VVFLGLFSMLQTTNCQIFDYTLYHNDINKAEKHFFINDEIDSCIYYYDKAFESFEFVFVKDLVNAAQIAFYCNKPYKKYIIRGFEFGLKIQHLKEIILFDDIYNSLENDEVLQSEYSIGRDKYLKSIDFSYLLNIYNMSLKDQIDKNLPDAEYASIKRENIYKIKQIIENKGFPGTKYLGVSDSKIFSEIGKPKFDIDSLKVKYGDKLEYYSADDNLLASKYALVILIHIRCSFKELSKVLRTSLKKGKIHPREIGLLYDNMFRNIIQGGQRCLEKNTSEGVFYLNKFCDYSKIKCSKDASNSLRSKWYIGTLDVDEKKKKYEKIHGFKLFWGFWKSI